MALDARPIPQVLLPGPLRRVLPHVLGRHPIRTELLVTYPRLSAKDAIALVRAAKLYGNAVWIAESDPSSAWLMLVSSLEVAAVQTKLAETAPEVMFSDWRPELSAAIREEAGPDLHSRIANEMAPLVRSTNRFIDFVLRFLPEAPSNRPPIAFQLKWSRGKMKESLNRIYELRSVALHTGIPFPPPMCERPQPVPGHVAGQVFLSEKPLGAYSTGSAVWTDRDIPMYLQTFEYIARHVLLNWWGALEKRGNQGAVEDRMTTF